MSHAGIEKLYEEQLQAAAPWLNLYVGGRFQRREPDTPSGRQRMEKAAFVARLEADEDTTVKVLRGVAGGRNAGPESDGEPPDPRSVPATARSVSACCKPEPIPGPSGVRLRHVAGCRAGLRGQPYAVAPAEPKVSRLASRHSRESRRTGLDDVLEQGGVLTAVGPQCPAHPSEPVFECLTCSGRKP